MPPKDAQDSQVGSLKARLSAVINRLQSPQRKALLVLFDFSALLLAHVVAISLLDGFAFPTWLNELAPLIIASSVAGVTAFVVLGFHNIPIRSFDVRTVGMLLIGSLLCGVALAFGIWIFSAPVEIIPLSVLYPILVFLLLGASRELARWFHQYSLSMGMIRAPVLIYGTGKAANQIASILRESLEFHLLGFIDDGPGTLGTNLTGRRVYGLNDIDSMVQKHGQLRVLFNATDLPAEQKRQVFSKFREMNVEVQAIPLLSDVVAGRLPLNKLRDLRIDDLLARNEVPPMASIFEDAIAGRTFLITGGGGTIGAGIAGQLVRNKAHKIVILDASEHALYTIDEELRNIAELVDSATEIHTFLGSSDNRLLVRNILENHQPDAVFHAAAFKHVHLVERNIVEGVRNNVFGTNVLAEECLEQGVERFILISTDKAVRPLGAMGATKRAAELIVQAKAKGQPDRQTDPENKSTIFCLVRFGNVFGSSGSVVPKFQSQIAKGGPLTVAHPEAARYFMSNRDASQLLIQAAFIAEGGEVFILDMGEPVKIDDIARLMIEMNVDTLPNSGKRNGNIEIVYSGLREGEKLHEELRISDQQVETIHPRIDIAQEEMPEVARVEQMLDELETAIDRHDSQMALNSLEKVVEGFRSPDKV